jgi:prepilin-type N-terminal cleavage/methylation domain-containing protein
MRPNSAPGFTLLEVMAAAVILSVVVLWLNSAVGQMNGYEGDSRRRVDAALFADRLLAELEQAAAQGGSIPLGTREAQEGMYQATIEVKPLDPTLLEQAGAVPRVASGEPPPEIPPAGWLDSPAAQAEPPVVSATIIVTGTEGRFEAGVTRTSFFLNPAALKALEQQGSDEGGEGDL